MAGTALWAQSNANPFELLPRMDPEEARANRAAQAQKDTAVVVSDNPFDLIRGTAPTGSGPRTITPRPANRPAGKQGNQRFLFITVLIDLVLLAFLITTMRPLVNKSIKAFMSDNWMNLLYRDREGRGLFPFLILYLLFFINLGLFLFLLARNYRLLPALSNLQLLGYTTVGSLLVFTLKHLLVGIVGYIFPVEKECRRYNFMIIIFSIVLGLLLVPFNLLLAYAPESFRVAVVYFAAGALGLAYLFRYLRGLLLANKFVLFHKFHFLLYICTVEIAPVVLVLKLIFSQL